MTPDKKLIHDIWLDYGPSEAVAYAKHCIAMEETDRLAPEILAQVDPSAFWSCVVHFQTFIKTLQEIGTHKKIIGKWLAMEEGSRASRRAIVEIGGSHLLPDKNGKWQIQNDHQHATLSLQNARAALVTVMIKAMEATNKISEPNILYVHTNLYYHGTEIGNDISEINQACIAGDRARLTKLLDALKPTKRPTTV
mmetsp:Transcript_4298/g.7170  ORF Transcript_4298/g.7170 Transcript_4298/m.7170 type:complete len:195 (-) Transcript_4298:156-740(-)